MGLPSKKELMIILKELDSKEGSLIPSKDASPIEKFRFELCQQFLKYKIKSNLNQKEMANFLGIDEAKISKILHYRISEFSTDRLLNLLLKIKPKAKLKVS